ncbi:hypothetical protein ABIB50_001842 [Mucilaginibacter sp. UYCu711]
MELKNFIKLFFLLLFCCSFFASKSNPHAPENQTKKSTFYSKVYGSTTCPFAPFIKFTLVDNNQEAIRQVHKTTNPVFTFYLLPHKTTTCVKYFNFFSGYNDHRYTLRNADFLFPFHAFW